MVPPDRKDKGNSMVTYETVRQNADIQEYIHQADKALEAIGFTEHALPHVTKAAVVAAMILTELGYDERTVELAKIAAHLHDIGNVVNRVDHAQSGAVLAFRLLDKMGMEAREIALVIGAIGNHDEGTAAAINPIAAALILADKTDVRRTRVRNNNFAQFDIHDRVNYAVENASVRLEREKHRFVLDLTIDTEISPVMDYFEIFLGRMMLCRKASEFFGLKFSLIINEHKLL